jgi:hypothetical protein
VVVGAARGGADTPRLGHRTRLGGPVRLRRTAPCGVERPGRAPWQAGRLGLAPGHARCGPRGWRTGPEVGPGPLAVARPWGAATSWAVSREAPTEVGPWQADGVRCDRAEHFGDAPSHGWQGASSLRRAAQALERWCGVWAMTPRSLVSVGTEGGQRGQRRWVDPHGCRGSSEVKRGWQGVRAALQRCEALIASLSVSSEPAPAPAMASSTQAQKRQQRFEFAYAEVA